MTLTTVLTDRDRLAAAFDELRQRGYLAPIEWAWQMCCMSCGLAAAAREGADKFVFWHAQKDDSAFFEDPYGDDWFEMSDDAEPSPEEEAAELAWRLDHANLVRPLYLHWGPEPSEAVEVVDVLHRHGIDAHWEGAEGRCIEVRPTQKRGPHAAPVVAVEVDPGPVECRPEVPAFATLEQAWEVILRLGTVDRGILAHELAEELKHDDPMPRAWSR